MKLLIIILVFLAFSVSIVAAQKFGSKDNLVATSSITGWAQRPAAIRYVGKYDRTYISWITSDGKIQMRFFDHNDQKQSDIQTVDDLSAEFDADARDDRNAPSLLMLPDGKIQIYYAVNNVNRAFFLKTTIHPEDINGWTSRKNIADNEETLFSLPQAKMLSGSDVVLFYRKGQSQQENENYKISHDFGQSWSEAVEFIDFEKENTYALIAVNDNELHVAWDNYYVFSPDGGITWQKSDGNKIDLPVNNSEGERVFNPHTEVSTVWDIVIKEDGSPVMAYASGIDPEHIFTMVKKTDSGWVSDLVTSSSLLYDKEILMSGGIIIDPKNTNKVYLSKKRDKLEMEIWETFDDGKSWQKTKSLTSGSAVDNFRPQLVENYTSGLRLLWSNGEYEGMVNDQWRGFDKVNIFSDRPL